MVCCWWCTLQIDGEEVGLPYKYESTKRRFHTMGHFCSWECAKAYNLDERRNGWGDIQNNITLFRSRLYGKVTRLRCAPHRFTLKKFGGTLSEEEFKNNRDPVAPQISMPSTVKFLHEPVEKKYSVKTFTEADTKRKIAEINNSTKKAEQLKLKRPIPLQYKQNNLENALGLTRKPPRTAT